MQTLLLLAALAGLSAPAQPAGRGTPAPQASHSAASASIRIVAAARIDAHAIERGFQGARVGQRTLVEPDGLTRRITLVEFE